MNSNQGRMLASEMRGQNPGFPMIGKSRPNFSNVWKTATGLLKAALCAAVLAALLPAPDVQAGVLGAWRKANSSTQVEPYFSVSNHPNMAAPAAYWKTNFYKYNDNSWFYIEPWYTGRMVNGISATNYRSSTGKPVTNYITFSFAISNGFKASFTNFIMKTMNDENACRFILKTSTDGYRTNLFNQPTTNSFRIYTNSFDLLNVTNARVDLRLYGTEAKSQWVYIYFTNIVNTAGSYLNYMWIIEGDVTRRVTIIPETGPLAGGNLVLLTNVLDAIGNGSDITNIVIGTASTTDIVGQSTNWVSWVNPPGDSAGRKDLFVQSTSVGSSRFTYEYLFNQPGGVLTNVPNSGASTGGFPVVIIGTNLCNGTTDDVVRVTLCGVDAQVDSVAGSTQIMVTAGSYTGSGRRAPTAGGAVTGSVVVLSTAFGTTIYPNSFTYDAPAAVVLFDFFLRQENGGVVVCWQTASEADTQGFDLYREEAGVWVKVNAAMVAAQGWPNGGIGAAYSVADLAAKVDGTYRYKLVEYETSGSSRDYGPFERSVWMPRLNNFTVTPAGIVLQWLSRDPEVYDVMKALDARAAYAPVATGLPATPPVNSWTDEAGTASGFYRIEAR